MVIIEHCYYHRRLCECHVAVTIVISQYDYYYIVIFALLGIIKP
jgi:hypothetical protein